MTYQCTKGIKGQGWPFLEDRMNVLSYFDGISCGQIALERAGIKVNKYYAAEIDKYAIKVTQSNYPDTIQLGDVTKVDLDSLPQIDLLIGGSPCQGFSFAGKQLNFNDSRSKLFFEFVKALKELKPVYFLLENVKMKKEYQNIISEHLGVEPIEINSSLVSAQNRKRLYWTNIPNVEQPVDKTLKASDFSGVFTDDSRVLNREITLIKSKGCIEKLGFYGNNSNSQRVYGINKKLPTLLTNNTGGNNPLWIMINEKVRMASIELCEWLQTVPQGYTDHASKPQRYKMLGNGWTVDVIAHIFSFMECTK